MKSEPEVTVPVLEVLAPGTLTTIQDLGRPTRRSAGIPLGGAMDRFALIAANRLVGNPDDCGGLECLVSGPRLAVLEPVVLAVTGADLQPRLNSTELPLWTSVAAFPGDVLWFAGRRAGARAYVAVAGGFAGERWLGSLSTFLLVGRGGMRGRALAAGDRLGRATVPGRPAVIGRRLREDLLPYRGTDELTVLTGPHLDRIAPLDRAALLGGEYRVSLDVDRMGIRLDGEPLTVIGEEALSFGLAMGAIQVPNNGMPIILMADHQTAGGYPVVATVIRADLPLAAQLLPGDPVRFRPAELATALGRWREMVQALDSIDNDRPTRTSAGR